MPAPRVLGTLGPLETEGCSVLGFLFPQGFCPQWDLLYRPGDTGWFSFMLFDVEMADHCYLFFNKSLFCWFQSPIDLCHFLSPPFVLRWTRRQGSSQVCISPACLQPSPHSAVQVEWGGAPGTLPAAVTLQSPLAGQSVPPDPVPGH